MTKFDEYKERFISQNVISDLSEDHLVFFVLFFVEILNILDFFDIFFDNLLLHSDILEDSIGQT